MLTKNGRDALEEPVEVRNGKWKKSRIYQKVRVEKEVNQRLDIVKTKRKRAYQNQNIR